MRDLNENVFTGRLTRDPESQSLPSGANVTKFAIAVNESYKNKDNEWVDKVVFVDFNVWNGNATALAERCRKGDFVWVKARYAPESWETPEGVRRTAARFTVLDWRKYDVVKKSPNGQEAADAPANSSATSAKPAKPPKPKANRPAVVVDEDLDLDIPF